MNWKFWQKKETKPITVEDIREAIKQAELKEKAEIPSRVQKRVDYIKSEMVRCAKELNDKGYIVEQIEFDIIDLVVEELDWQGITAEIASFGDVKMHMNGFEFYTIRLK